MKTEELTETLKDLLHWVDVKLDDHRACPLCDYFDRHDNECPIPKARALLHRSDEPDLTTQARRHAAQVADRARAEAVEGGQ